MPPNPGMTPEEAIYDVRERMVGVETELKNVVKTMTKTCDELDATRKKVGRLEVRFMLLVGLLIGSGVLGGVGISQLIG